MKIALLNNLKKNKEEVPSTKKKKAERWSEIKCAGRIIMDKIAIAAESKINETW